MHGIDEQWPRPLRRCLSHLEKERASFGSSCRGPGACLAANAGALNGLAVFDAAGVIRRSERKASLHQVEAGGQQGQELSHRPSLDPDAHSSTRRFVHRSPDGATQVPDSGNPISAGAVSRVLLLLHPGSPGPLSAPTVACRPPPHFILRAKKSPQPVPLKPQSAERKLGDHANHRLFCLCGGRRQ